MALEFDPVTHAYRVDGEPWASVTQILDAMGASNYDHVPPDVLAFARERGQLVHQACHYDDQGDLDETTLDPALAPYVEAWRGFRAEYHVEPIAELVEQPLAHHVMRYCGTPDAPSLIDGWPAVIDRKVVAAIQPATALQTAAYSMLLRAQGAAAASFATVPASKIRRLAVNLRDDGTFRVEEHTGFADERTWLAMLTAYHWRRRHGLVRLAVDAPTEEETAA